MHPYFYTRAKPSDNIGYMAWFWGPVIVKEGPSKTLLRRIDPDILAIIMIWKRMTRWVQNRMRKVAQVARDSIEYAPGGLGYLNARQNFRYHGDNI